MWNGDQVKGLRVKKIFTYSYGATSRMCLTSGPTMLSCALNTPLPEAWPLSPFALFMWNGDQVKGLGVE